MCGVYNGGVSSFLDHWGYLALFVLMLAESACIPIPSELTLGLAGALASGASISGIHTHLNLAAIIAVGTIGSVVGSYVAYVVGRTGGRAFVDRYGKYVLLSHRDLDKAEVWFDRRGEWAVLIGRVLPVVRTFISLPAGMAEMEPRRFGILTAIGCAIWTGALAAIGYELGTQYHTMVKAVGDATYVVGVIVVIAVVVAVVHRFRTVRAEQRPPMPLR